MASDKLARSLAKTVAATAFGGPLAGAAAGVNEGIDLFADWRAGRGQDPVRTAIETVERDLRGFARSDRVPQEQVTQAMLAAQSVVQRHGATLDEIMAANLAAAPVADAVLGRGKAVLALLDEGARELTRAAVHTAYGSLITTEALPGLEVAFKQAVLQRLPVQAVAAVEPTPRLSASAAARLCAGRVDATVRVLELTDRLASAQHVPRDDVDAAVGAFLGGERPVLALTGPSGVGKTAQMVQIARAAQAIGHAALPFEAADLAPEHARLEAGLGGVAISSDGIDVDMVAEALKTGDGILVVLVDALNELPPELKRSWPTFIGRTAAWLEDRANVRLVVSCRTESWQHFAGFLRADKLHGGQPVFIGDFDAAEAEQALAAYGLENRGIEPDAARHPLLLRIYARIAAEAPGGVRRLSIVDGVEEYVRQKARDVASRLGADTRPDRVRRVLERVAEMAGAGELRISQEQLDEASGGNARLADVLLDEHVLVPVRGGLRFAFDQAGEFLQARSVDPDTIVERLALAVTAEDGAETAGAYVFALIDLERQGKYDELRQALDDLLDRLEGQPGSVAYAALGPVLSRLEDGEQFAAQLLRIAEAFTPTAPPLQLLLARDVMALRLSPRHRLACLRLLLPAEHRRDLRPTDWPAIGDVVRRRRHIAAYADQVLRDEPGTAIPLLAEWLDDERKLRERAATVRDVAAALLALRADLAPELTFEHVAAAAERGHDMGLRLFAGWRPDVVASQLERGLADRPIAALLAAGAALASTKDSAIRTSLLGTLTHFLASEDGRRAPNVRQLALETLADYDETALDVFDEILDALRNRRTPAIPLTKVALRRDPRRVLPPLLALTLERPEFASMLASLTGDMPLTTAEESALTRVLENACAAEELRDQELALWIERRLIAAADGPSSEVAGVARRLAQHPEPAVREPLEYFAEDEPAVGEAEATAALRLELRRLLA